MLCVTEKRKVYICFCFGKTSLKVIESLLETGVRKTPLGFLYTHTHRIYIYMYIYICRLKVEKFEAFLFSWNEKIILNQLPNTNKVKGSFKPYTY